MANDQMINVKSWRGFCAPHAHVMSAAEPRGIKWYPGNLRVQHDDPSSALGYDEWMAALAAAGVNMMHIVPGGRSRAHAAAFCGIEPPPWGSYNIWHTALDPGGDLGRYRAEQVTHPVSQDMLEASNVWRLLEAARQHGVGIWWSLFESGEVVKDWWLHPWYRGCRYINEEFAEKRDRGFLEHRWQIFTDPQAIEAAKGRVRFVLDAFGEHPAIAVWELMAEMVWLTKYEFWGEPEYSGVNLRRHVREEIRPWVAEMVAFIKANDPLHRPVANSQIFTAGHTSWPEDPDHYINVVNEIHAVPGLDVVAGRWYGGRGLKWAADVLRMGQEKFPDKLVVIGEYWPWERGDVPVSEKPPYRESKAMEWLAACSGSVVARWPGTVESVVNVWVAGGYADPAMAEIAGATQVLDECADWDSWDREATRAWDGDISVEGAEVAAGYGDGRRVTLFVRWPGGGSKGVEVSGLLAGEYDLHVFDWLEGKLSETRRLVAREGVLAFDYVGDTLAACLVVVERPGCWSWKRCRWLG